MLSAEILKVDSLTFNTSYDRNDYGYISKITYPSGDSVNQSPDSFGRPRSLTAENVGFNKVYATDVDYHLNNSIKGFIYGNGIKFRQELNSRLLPEKLVDWNQVGVDASILDIQYTYDDRNNITDIYDAISPSQSVTNDYNGLNQLINANSAFGNVSFNYDSIGNLRKRSVIGGTSSSSKYIASMNYNQNNQLASASIGSEVRPYTYDSRGNVTSNGKKSFFYDLANQLTSSGSDSFWYDGNLKRAKKVSSSGAVYFVYTKEVGLVSQYNRSKSIHTDYIRLGKKLISRVESAGSTADNFYTQPFNETINDKPNQGLSGRNYCLPFGKSLNNESTVDNSIGYTGHISDDSGLTYMQARYYDPVIGRFLSNDPVGSIKHLGRTGGIHGFNRYAYANNNPYKYIDPDGREVTAVFNNSTGTLTVTDNDTGKTATASAFSGQEGYTGAPNGTYTITDFPWGSSLQPNYFAIVRHDAIMNDIAEGFQSNYNPDEDMQNLRLHKGSTSHGCVSVPNSKEWSNVQNLIDNTKKGTPVTISGESFPTFGQLTVTGERTMAASSALYSDEAFYEWVSEGITDL
tara:strand:- start:1024 stop:2748 length:1725 start_codon:yes stop_codon:yes gene_type:complete